MENLILGKVLKAMQKLSGKSVGDLADETELTIDTINNLFYARVQKPGFDMVCRLTETMGFSVTQLMTLIRDPALQQMDIPQIMEILAENTGSVEGALQNTVQAVKDRTAPRTEMTVDYETYNHEMNAMHEKQLDRFRATHLNYVDQIRKQYEAQLEQSEAHKQITIHGLEKLLTEQKERVTATADRFEKQVTEVRAAYETASAQLQKQIAQLRRQNSWLIAVIVFESVSLLLLLFK